MFSPRLSNTAASPPPSKESETSRTSFKSSSSKSYSTPPSSVPGAKSGQGSTIEPQAVNNYYIYGGQGGTGGQGGVHGGAGGTGEGPVINQHFVVNVDLKNFVVGRPSSKQCNSSFRKIQRNTEYMCTKSATLERDRLHSNGPIPTGTTAASHPPRPKMRCAKSTICRLRKTISGLQSSLDASAARISHLESIIADLRANNVCLASTVIGIQEIKTNSLRTQLDTSVNGARSECLSHLEPLATSERQAHQESMQGFENVKASAAKTEIESRIQSRNSHVLRTPSFIAERESFVNDQKLIHQHPLDAANVINEIAEILPENRMRKPSDLLRRHDELSAWDTKAKAYLQQIHSQIETRLGVICRVCICREGGGAAKEKVKDVVCGIRHGARDLNFGARADTDENSSALTPVWFRLEFLGSTEKNPRALAQDQLKEQKDSEVTGEDINLREELRGECGKFQKVKISQGKRRNKCTNISPGCKLISSFYQVTPAKYAQTEPRSIACQHPEWVKQLAVHTTARI
ncbi:hypothetical protein C8R45DRAFT_1074066 [Mycena sanguinolenta]|nr:hypothetical protein C8R45DRAFT_1074066 [Mycena sanguinolenta]